MLGAAEAAAREYGDCFEDWSLSVAQANPYGRGSRRPSSLPAVRVSPVDTLPTRTRRATYFAS